MKSETVIADAEHLALVVVLNDQWVQDAERSLNQAHARAVIANQIAGNQKPQ